MSDLIKRCISCKRRFRPARQAGHRLYCYTCRPVKSGDIDSTAPKPVIPLIPENASDDDPLLVAIVREELTNAGVLRTPEGLVTMRLAREIATASLSPTGLAALTKQFHESKTKALAATPAEADVIDGLFGASG